MWPVIILSVIVPSLHVGFCISNRAARLLCKSVTGIFMHSAQSDFPHRICPVSTQITAMFLFLFKCAEWITGWSRLWSALECTSSGWIRIQMTPHCGWIAQVGGHVTGSYVWTTRCVSELSRAHSAVDWFNIQAWTCSQVSYSLHVT